VKKILSIVMILAILFAIGAAPASAKLSLSDYSNKELSKMAEDEIVYSAIMYECPDSMCTLEFSYWVQQNYLVDTMIWDVAEKQEEFFEEYKEYVESKRQDVLAAGEVFFEKHFDSSADELIFNSNQRALIAVKSTAAKVRALGNAEGCWVIAIGDFEHISERFNTNDWAALVPPESSLKEIYPYELVYALDFYKDKETPRYCGDGWLDYFYSPLYYHYPAVTGDEATADEPDYILAFAGNSIVSPALSAESFGDKYLVQRYNCYYPYILGIHIITTSDAPNYKVYSLREAWDMGLEGIEDVFTDFGLGEIRGDSDGDKEITVKDATYLQKCISGVDSFKDREYISGIVENNYDSFNGRISDMNMDGKVNIRDATAIQKAVAGLPYK